MKYYCNPLNIEYKYQFYKDLRSGKESYVIYREAADPSLVLFKGLYYLFPSMTAGFYTSENLIDWEFHGFLNAMPVYDYAPDVRPIGDYLYFSASKAYEKCSFFRTKDPLTEPFEEMEGTFPFWDPNLFYDDDGRLYFYWGCSNMTPIYGVELNPETMEPLSEPKVMFASNIEERGYERNGDDHISPKTKEEIDLQVEAMMKQFASAPLEQRKSNGIHTEEDMRRIAYSVAGNDPYIEGSWMTKYKGKYYLQYAIPGTQYNVYGDGVYVSDSPLGPYTPAKNNPYSYKPGGFITGAGHGSTLEDKEGRFWHTSTMRISINQDFERRLGLWKAGFDEDGELYCDQRYGDWPINVEQPAFAKPDWMLLSYGKSVKVSSGDGAANISDEDIRTWWKASSNQSGEWVEIDLGKAYDVRAIQINFAEDGIQAETPKQETPGVTSYNERYIDRVVQQTRWIMEGSVDGINYVKVEDKSEVNTDYSHDFILREDGIEVRYLRLTIIALPYNQIPCISGLRVFGITNGHLPMKATDVKIQLKGDLDLEVSWEKNDALGHNILWGYTPDKLYHSYMVFGQSNQSIGALIQGEPLYIRVDAFNESGVTEGDIIKVRL